MADSTDMSAAPARQEVHQIPESFRKTSFPPELDLHLILDNYSTQKSEAVQRSLKPATRRRFHFHFIPASSSSKIQGNCANDAIDFPVPLALPHGMCNYS